MNGDQRGNLDHMDHKDFKVKVYRVKRDHKVNLDHLGMKVNTDQRGSREPKAF